MPKRLCRTKPICSCVSPRHSFITPRSIFNWYEEDLWTEIAKFLDGKSLVRLATTSRWFHGIIMEESVWKYACLRDLQVPDPGKVAFKWIKLYATAFDGSHSYVFRQQEKHIDWMRIGAFFFSSSAALLTEDLVAATRFPNRKMVDKGSLLKGGCVVNNIKTGIWIADLHLVRCPVCDLKTCDGTMQTLEARHIEVFLNEGYKAGSWNYELLEAHDIKKNSDAASGAIFDLKYLKDRSTSDVLDLKSWIGKPNDWQPKAMIAFNAVAVNTNLQKNDGLHIKYHTMKAGNDGEVVSIRISHQLL